MKITLKPTACILIILVFVFSCYSQKEDVFGWQKTRWGMSEKEIIDTFKEDIKKLPERQIFHRAYVDYVIPFYEINDRKYTVFFQMDNETNKLKQVLVRYNEMESKFPKDIYFNGLDSLLTRKYGDPKIKRDEKDSSNLSLERQWAFPTTTIRLSYSWMDLIQYSLLTITYFPTKGGDFEKV